MSAKGTFEVELTPQEDRQFPAGRMLISKSDTGRMSGSGIGQVISRTTEEGTAVDCAIEKFPGSVNGKTNGFTLVHKGTVSEASELLEVDALVGSGSDQLQGIFGSMVITRQTGAHSNEIRITL